MSMSEPFLPAHEPPAEPDPREHDLDGDVDVLPEPSHRGRHRADDAPDIPGGTRTVADGPVPDGAAEPPFRTPEPHHGLTADQLERELGEAEE